MKYLLRSACARICNLFSPFNEEFKPRAHRAQLPGKEEIYARHSLWNVFLVNRILTCIVCTVFISIMCGCQGSGTSQTLVTVDDERISIDEFNDRFTKVLVISVERASLTREDYGHLKEEVLNSLINEKVMLLRARELSLAVGDAELMKKVEEIKESYSDDFFERVLTSQRVDYGLWKEELRKRMILEKLISSDVNAKITVKENEIRAFHKAHRRMYAPEKRVHVAQIVVREHEKAEMILNRLKMGEDFGKVAREESIGPEGVEGGDIGFVSLGIMPEEIDAVVFSKKPGEISAITKSPYGYHIFKIIENDEGTNKKWTDVKNQVMIDLIKQKEEQAYVLWLEALRSRVTIKIDRNLLEKRVIPQDHENG